MPIRSPGPPTLSDADLVRAWLAGDDRAFEVLVHRRHGGLLRVARCHGWSAQDADELVAEVFTRFCRQARSDASRVLDGPTTWLHQVLRRVMIDTWRKRSRSPVVDMEVADQYLAAPDTSSVDLDQWLGRQNPTDRHLFLAAHHAGHTLDEIALDLDRPRSTLHDRLRRVTSAFLAWRKGGSR